MLRLKTVIFNDKLMNSFNGFLFHKKHSCSFSDTQMEWSYKNFKFITLNRKIVKLIEILRLVHWGHFLFRVLVCRVFVHFLVEIILLFLKMRFLNWFVHSILTNPTYINNMGKSESYSNESTNINENTNKEYNGLKKFLEIEKKRKKFIPNLFLFYFTLLLVGSPHIITSIGEYFSNKNTFSLDYSNQILCFSEIIIAIFAFYIVLTIFGHDSEMIGSLSKQMYLSSLIHLIVCSLFVYFLSAETYCFLISLTIFLITFNVGHVSYKFADEFETEARQLFRFLPSCSDNFSFKDDDLSPHKSKDVSVSPQTNLELLICHLHSILEKYKFNADLVAEVYVALKFLRGGPDSLFAINPKSVPSSSDNNQQSSDVFKFIEALDPSKQSDVVSPSPKKTCDRTILFGSKTTTDIEKLLEKNPLGAWSFNCFGVYKVSHGKPLSAVMMSLEKRCCISEGFDCTESKLCRLIAKIESMYQKNPYHNSLHATDVTNSLFYFFSVKCWPHRMTPLQYSSALLAASAHDVAHPGRTNNFLVSTGNALAFRYNDKSVLENMHSAVLFELAQQPETNVFESLHREEWRKARNIITEMILETDMQKHFSAVGSFRSHFQNSKGWGDSDKDWYEDWDSSLLLLKFLMKCADLGHAAKEQNVHVRWSRLLFAEFFSQGDSEKLLGLPLTPLCNRHEVDCEKSQVDFIQVLCIPMFGALCDFLECDQVEKDIRQQLLQNLDYWKYRSSSLRTYLNSKFKRSSSVTENSEV